MSFKMRKTHSPTCRIPATSVADIAFLLVVFFALIANEPDRTRVTLPESDAQAPADENSAIVVVGYDADNADLSRPTYKFSDGEAQSRLVDGTAAIGSEASKLLEIDPARQFRLKADGRTPCRIIGNVLDELTRVGGNEVVMVTSQKSREVAP